MRKIITFLFLAAVALGAVAVSAAEPAPFTEDELLRCVTDMPQFVKHMEAHGQDIDAAEDVSAMQQLAAQQGAMAWFREKGWDPERFSYVLDHMGKGYVAMKVRQEMGGAPMQMPAMDMSGMTPEMQAQMQAQMAAAMAMGQLAAAQQAEGVPESELALIEAHMDEIVAMFEGLE